MQGKRGQRGEARACLAQAGVLEGQPEERRRVVEHDAQVQAALRHKLDADLRVSLVMAVRCEGLSSPWVG